jgi:SAM-dependent methyltransferase
MLGYNRTCNLEDFADPGLRRLIREIFADELALFPADYPDGVADSKQWEIAMAVRALRDHGCLTRQSRILGVGAGTELTSFYLTRHVGEVVATDIYGDAHVWADVAPRAFLVDPSRFATIEYEKGRLIPLHMDGRALTFRSNSFDGVYSSGSIEHFGSLENVANSAYEIGRVLRPGGIATIATEFKVAGPPEGDGWDPNVILFSEAKLKKYIIEASGLELVDALDLELSESTLSVRRDLASFLDGTRGPVSAAKKIANYPNLILYHGGYLFCSVHLALRKPQSRVAGNSWAAPSKETRAQIRESDAKTCAEAGSALLAELRDRSEDDGPTQQDRIAELTAGWEWRGAELVRLQDRVTLLSAEWERHQVERAELEAARKSWESAYHEVKASLSWRITAPLRAVFGPGYEALRSKRKG